MFLIKEVGGNRNGVVVSARDQEALDTLLNSIVIRRFRSRRGINAETSEGVTSCFVTVATNKIKFCEVKSDGVAEEDCGGTW